jgi:hypothetical protein
MSSELVSAVLVFAILIFGLGFMFGISFKESDD